VTVLLPAWLQNGAYNAEIDRSLGTALLNPASALSARSGVRLVSGSEFSVVTASPVGMSVRVNPGMAWVQGAYLTTQGAYTVVNDAIFSLSIATSNPSNPRIDLVILEVLDAVYAGASNVAAVRVLQGTPGVTPVAPTATGSYIPLAQVRVPAGAGSITSGNITDVRPFSGAYGSPVPVRNIGERNAISGPYNGLQAALMDNAFEVHTYSGGAWYGSNERYLGIPSVSTFSAITDSNPHIAVDRAKVPDPGFPYMVKFLMDMEISGAAVDATVFLETTTTLSLSHSVGFVHSASQAAGVTTPGRMRIWFTAPEVVTGNRWLSVRLQKNASEAPATSWTNTNYQFNGQITIVPARTASFTLSTTIGGQP
jgi:hypothetical protein